MPFILRRFYLYLDPGFPELLLAPLIPLFKTLSIRLGFPVNNDMVDNIKQIQNCIFSRASCLVVDIHHYPSNFMPIQEEIQQCFVNVSMTIDPIRRMAPKVSGVKFYEDGKGPDCNTLDGRQYQILFS